MAHPKWLIGIALVPLMLGVAREPQAMSYVMIDDVSLLEQSHGVARFVVEAVEPVQDGDRETRYRLRRESTLAGKAVGATETLALPGTFDAPNVNYVVHGVPKLRLGQTVLVFYHRRADGVLQPQQLTLGLFGEADGDAGKIYVRYLEDGGDLGSGKNAQYAGVRSASGFDMWIRDRARGLRPAATYLDATTPQSKYTLTNFSFPTPGPGRWFQFDSGQSLPWTAASGGQANTSRDEFAALQQALAAWTNDPGSRIQMHYVGTAAAPSGAAFSGFVRWNDPNNEIAGSYNCGSGGVLAIGGSHATSNGSIFGGRTWYPRTNAFVTVQDGAGCALDSASGANGAELLTHEVGHAIAFGHSCGDSSTPSCGSNATLNDAVMRASLHGDGRGASLRADDRAAAAVAYPVPGGGTGGTVRFRNGFE